MSTPHAPTPQANVPADQPAPHAQPTVPLPRMDAPLSQQPQPFQQPGYPQQQTPYTPQPARTAVAPSQATTLGATNTFALLAILFAFVSPIAGIVFGHMGLSQIKRQGDAGRGIALAGLIISYVYVVFMALFIIFYVFIIVAMFGAMGSVFSGATDYSFSS